MVEQMLVPIANRPSVSAPSKGKHLVVMLSASGADEIADIFRILCPDSGFWVDELAYARRYFETRNIAFPSWCTGGGNRDPHVFHNWYIREKEFRGVIFVVEEWEYAAFELDYLPRDMRGCWFVLLIWIVKRPFVTETTENDFRAKLKYSIPDNVPVHFELIDLKDKENCRLKMCENLAWLLRQKKV